MSDILVIDDDKAICRMLQMHLGGLGHTVHMAHNVDAGLAKGRAVVPDVIILDIRMTGKSGLQGLPEFKQLLPATRIIMITAHHDVEATIRAMKLGADEYIHKPLDLAELEKAVATALRYQQSERNDSALCFPASGQTDQGEMVGHSHAMHEVFKIIGKVAPTPTTVLISGESGTGKELVARAIHRAGNNPDGPFVAVNCAALVDTLLEAEMFGHEKGAFTGAVERRPGKFGLANGGTIFLDEIGELSLLIQAKLLRVLAERQYTPVGGKHSLSTDARVIAATNVDLAAAVTKGGFREDLYYRLQVLDIHLPPLRERKEDIPVLVQTLLARINKSIHKSITRVSRRAMTHLADYNWPGNVRELENTLLKAAAICPGDTLTTEQLPGKLLHVQDTASMERPSYSPFRSLADIQRQQVIQVLEATGWHKGNAVQILGISRPKLQRLIELYGLSNPADCHTEHDDD